jgi:photosystem II stability/assembly factor-like uncharacterized protein
MPQITNTTVPLNAISCASSIVCVAVGGGTNAGAIALFTTDAGLHWLAGSPTPANGLRSVSCPSAAVCLAVGDWGTALKTTDGGANWATLSPNVVQSSISTISCPTTATCLILEPGGTHATTDGGTTWVMRSTSTSQVITCLSATTCYSAGLYGAIATTSDGGTSWSSLAYTVTSEPLIRVKCPSVSTCFVIGNDGFYARNGGPYPAAIFGTTDGGKTWLKRYDAPTGGLSDISCPSVSSCFVNLGNSILSTSDGGAHWTQLALNDTSFAVYGIDCPSPTVCFAVGGMQNNTAAIVYTTNAWATWTVMPSAGPQYLSSVSCSSIQTCVAVGYAGTIMRTTDGVNWSTSTAPTVATQQLRSVDCPSAAACFAVANGNPSSIFATTDGGATWSLQSSPATNFLWDVDCATTTTCMVAGRGAILGTTDGGTTWSLQKAGTNNDLVGVDCPATTVCSAVGYSGTILALPPGPPTLWWTQPVQRSTVSRPPVPWYVKRITAPPPPPTPRAAPRAALAPHSSQPSPSSGPTLRAATQADVSRILPGVVEQIARALQSIVSQRAPGCPACLT